MVFVPWEIFTSGYQDCVIFTKNSHCGHGTETYFVISVILTFAEMCCIISNSAIKAAKIIQKSDMFPESLLYIIYSLLFIW